MGSLTRRVEFRYTCTNVRTSERGTYSSSADSTGKQARLLDEYNSVPRVLRTGLYHGLPDFERLTLFMRDGGASAAGEGGEVATEAKKERIKNPRWMESPGFYMMKCFCCSKCVGEGGEE